MQGRVCVGCRDQDEQDRDRRRAYSPSSLLRLRSALLVAPLLQFPDGRTSLSIFLDPFLFLLLFSPTRPVVASSSFNLL